MSKDLRKDNNRIQMQLVRLMRDAQTWHDMEQIAQAMAAVEIRHNSIFMEDGMLRGSEPSKSPGTYMDALEVIRREHNGIFGIRLFLGHDGHNVCLLEDYDKEICRGESGRSMDEAVARCIQTWNMQREQEAVAKACAEIQQGNIQAQTNAKQAEYSPFLVAGSGALSSLNRAIHGPACAEQTTINCGGQPVRIVCGEPESAHTPEAAKADVAMDHNFIPGTWDAEAPRNQA